MCLSMIKQYLCKKARWMEAKERILPRCSSGSGVGHPVQQLKCSFPVAGDMRREQAKLLLSSVKKKKNSRPDSG